MRTDIKGKRFGKLIAIKDAGAGERGRLWLCKCDCGSNRIAFTNQLKAGYAQSCGQLKCHKHFKYGKSKTPEACIWRGMLNRCYNKKHLTYKKYGARGIAVCRRWKKSFPNFLSDMGLRPTPKHSIERKNNNGNYTPQNCKWATFLEQGSNKRNNVWITFNKQTLTLSQWARKVGITQSSMTKRLRRHPKEAAVGTPKCLPYLTLCGARRGRRKLNSKSHI